MKIIGAIIPILTAEVEAYRVRHHQMPVTIVMSQDVKDRLVLEVDDVREFFGGKRTGSVERYRKIPITIQNGENVLRAG